MPPGHAEPGPRLGDDRFRGNTHSAFGVCTAASRPGTNGKPRKLAMLANFAWQVAADLSQPAAMLKVSFTAIGKLVGRNSVTTPAASLFTSSGGWPRLAPAVQVNRPPSKKPAARPPLIVAVNRRVA